MRCHIHRAHQPRSACTTTETGTICMEKLPG
jgi:hypothetical protein